MPSRAYTGQPQPAQLVGGLAGDDISAANPLPVTGTITAGSPVSAGGLAWQVSVTNADTPLAKVWAQSTAYLVGAVVVGSTGALYRCTTAGTSASSGTGPSTLGTGIGDGAGALVWKGVAKPANGIKITNTDPPGGSNTVFTDFGSVTAATGDAIVSGTSEVLPVSDPSQIHCITAGNTVVVTALSMS